MTNMIRIAALALPISLVTAMPSFGAVIDPLDTAAGFNDSFNGTTALANGDGTVTLTRTTANVDAGINWTDMGSKVQINAGQNVLKVTPSAAINGGYYGINILFFDGADQYITESVWLNDTNSLAVQELSDIAAFADPNAASFVLRFRIQPWGQAGAGFTFNQIEVVPEPASLALMGFGGLMVLRRGHKA